MATGQHPFLIAGGDPQFSDALPGLLKNAESDLRSKARRLVALLQLIIGSVSILCGVVIIIAVFSSGDSPCGGDRSAVGIWFGGIYILVGVGEYITEKDLPVSYYLALSISTCVVSVVGIIVASFVITCSFDGVVVAFNSVLIAIYCLEMAASIAGAIITFTGVNCCKQAPTVIHYYASGTSTEPAGNLAPSHNFGLPVNTHEDLNQSRLYYTEPTDTFKSWKDNLTYSIPRVNETATTLMHHSAEQVTEGPPGNRALPQIPASFTNTKEETNLSGAYYIEPIGLSTEPIGLSNDVIESISNEGEDVNDLQGLTRQ